MSGLPSAPRAHQKQVGKEALVFEHGDVDGIDPGMELLRFRRHPAVEPVESARGGKGHEVRVGVEARIVERLVVTTTEGQERLGGLGHADRWHHFVGLMVV